MLIITKYCHFIRNSIYGSKCLVDTLHTQVAGYINKKDYAYALKLGAACGNATAFSEGLATADEIEHVFDIM